MNQDFKEFIESLNTNDVQYLVIGGYAVAFHGVPRYTKVLDIWINPTVENAIRIISALKEFGFQSLGIQVGDLTTPAQTIQLGYPPERIDLITTIDGVEFSECYQKGIKFEDSGVTINVIDLENLIKNKKASGRAQDIADLENLI
ncbi:MAG: hypothetical protein FD147_1704 [Chloroflexi bacterium]|nr:MAG: hypothetical protein FD147_1704 [Chloroflexota bacterium]